MKAVTQTIDETRRFAGDIIVCLRKCSFVGERATVLCLSGPLGAGKTALVKCIAEVLGVGETVTSPTFVLRVDYDTADAVFSRLVHIDGYRLESPDEVRTIGWDDLLRMSDTLVAVEWAERFGSFLPDDVFSVSVSVDGGAHSFVFSEHAEISRDSGFIRFV